MKISMKHPGLIDEEISIACVEFQLSLIFAETISRQHIMPHSLNYLGYKDQDMVYLCEDCIYDENEHYKTIEFNVSSVDISFEAILVSHQGLLTVELEDITETS